MQSHPLQNGLLPTTCCVLIAEQSARRSGKLLTGARRLGRCCSEVVKELQGSNALHRRRRRGRQAAVERSERDDDGGADLGGQRRVEPKGLRHAHDQSQQVTIVSISVKHTQLSI